MDYLLQLDQSIFHFINEGCKNTFLDWLLPYWRDKVCITDATSSWLVKNNIERIRPCNQKGFKETAHLLVPCGSGYSFTSSHAANHFSIAIFLILTLGRIWKWIRFPLIFWAGSIVANKQWERLLLH